MFYILDLSFLLLSAIELLRNSAIQVKFIIIIIIIIIITICSHVHCLLSWWPSFADTSLLEQQLPFHPPFQSSIQVNSTSIEQNVSIQENLNAAISL